MSVQRRIAEAESSWKGDRKEAALLAVLSAAVETARRRYSQKDAKEALTHFVGDIVQLGGGAADQFDWSFRGGISLGEVLYDVYQTLLATGKLPHDVELSPGEEFQVHVLDGNRRGYSDSLIPRLINAVKRAPENRREFAKRKGR